MRGAEYKGETGVSESCLQKGCGQIFLECNMAIYIEYLKSIRNFQAQLYSNKTYRDAKIYSSLNS